MRLARCRPAESARQLHMPAVLCLVSALGSFAAGAHDPDAQNDGAELTVSQAFAAAQAAVNQCRKDGYRISAAVVDRAGLIKAQLRDDGAGPHTLDSSRRKAYTAASLRKSTGKLAMLVGQRPELQGLGQMNDSILLLGGGFPIRLGSEIVGGIGVGGAPGVALDERCAKAGLQALGIDH